MVRDSGERQACVYQAHITEATHGDEVGRQGRHRQGARLNQFKRLQRVQRREPRAPTRSRSARTRTAALATETAMAWHLEAVGSERQRGTGDQKTMELAAALYKKVVDNFKSDDFAKFEFPRIVKEDWPTIYKIKYAMADFLYFQREVGGVRSGVRRRRRRRTRRRPRRPRPRTRRCSATRTSTLEHAQGRLRQEGQRQPAGRRQEGIKAGRREDKYSRRRT